MPVGDNNEALKSIPGFYPTPATVVAMMLNRLGEIFPGERVLEPSAGRGDIADYLRRVSADITLVEPNPRLAQQLRDKGYVPIEGAFEDFDPPATFKKVVMNPPFADGRDMAHVRRAFAMLSPGGCLVALMNDGDDAFDGTPEQRAEFAAWLLETRAITSFSVERLDQVLFQGPESYRASAIPMKLVTLMRAEHSRGVR